MQDLTPALKRFLTNFYKKEASFFTAPPAASVPSARTKFNIAFLNAHIHEPVRSVLEIGAYDGYFLDAVRKNFQAKEAIGIEIMQSKNRFPKIRLIHDSYPTSAVAGKKFDLIIIMNVLEHVFTPHDFMQNLGKNLTENGKILIEIPNEQWTFESGMFSYQHQHISYFTPITVRRFLASLGFTIDALYRKDLDRILILCSKNKRLVPQYDFVDTSSRGYRSRSQAVLKKFKALTISGRPVGLYGACTFTHNILQATDVSSDVVIFDGDKRKEGTYMSDIKRPVQSWQAIDPSRLKKVVIMPLAFTREIYNFLNSKKIRTPIRKFFNA